MNISWIQTALRGGGELRVRRVPQLRDSYSASMTWPDAAPISAIGLTIEDALEKLNRALMLDAAEEMQKSGKV